MSKDKAEKAEIKRAEKAQETQEKAEKKRAQTARKAQEKADKVERHRAKEAKETQEKADKVEKDRVEKDRLSERARLFDEVLNQASARSKGCCEPCNFVVKTENGEYRPCRVGHKDSGPDKEVCVDCTDSRYHPKK